MTLERDDLIELKNLRELTVVTLDTRMAIQKGSEGLKWLSIQDYITYFGNSRAVTVINVDTATWLAALAVAAPGAVLLLAPGSYGSATLTDIDKATPGVTILGQPGVVFNFLTIVRSSWLIFKDFRITDKNSSGYASLINESQNVTLDNVTMDSGVPNGNGVLIRGQLNANINVINCHITDKGAGIGTLNGSALLIQGNSINRVAVDGVLVQGGDGITVDHNFISTAPVTSGHPDPIQFSTAFDTGARPTNVVVSNNNFDRGTGGEAQFIFMERTDNFLVENNAGFGTMVNGVAMSDCKHGIVRNNFSQGWAPVSTKDIVRSASDDIVIQNNFATLFENYNGGGTNTNITMGPNTLIPSATSLTDRARYEAFVTLNNLPRS